jgi:hypothetical protein
VKIAGAVPFIPPFGGFGVVVVAFTDMVVSGSMGGSVGPNSAVTEAIVGGCHESAGTPLRTHANGEDSGLEESRQTIRT